MAGGTALLTKGSMIRPGAAAEAHKDIDGRSVYVAGGILAYALPAPEGTWVVANECIVTVHPVRLQPPEEFASSFVRYARH